MSAIDQLMSSLPFGSRRSGRPSLRQRLVYWLFSEQIARVRLMERKLDSLFVVEPDLARTADLQLLAKTDDLTELGQDNKLTHANQNLQSTELVKINDNVERLLALLEPRAARLQATRRPLPDWNAVEQENLQDFEDKPNGV